MAVITHPDLSTDFIKAKLLGDATLMALTVTQNGVARAVQGVYYMVAPQEVENPYPCVIIEQPLFLRAAQHLNCNGVFIAQATFSQDVIAQARDVEADDAGLRAIRARIKVLLEGQGGAVTGGNISQCKVRGYSPDIRRDNGSYIYSGIRISFEIATQVT